MNASHRDNQRLWMHKKKGNILQFLLIQPGKLLRTNYDLQWRPGRCKKGVWRLDSISVGVTGKEKKDKTLIWKWWDKPVGQTFATAVWDRLVRLAVKRSTEPGLNESSTAHQTVWRGSSPQAYMDHGLQEMCSQLEINMNSCSTHQAVDQLFHIAYLHPYLKCVLTVTSQ